MNREFFIQIKPSEMKRTFMMLVAISAMLYAHAQGSYIEYKISSADGIGGYMKTYHQNGNTRTEIKMELPNMPGGMTRTALILKSDPKKSLMLNETNKTYTETTMDGTDNTNIKQTEYEVTVLGKEKVDGYNSTHVKVKLKGSTSAAEEEMWLSTEVVNYAKYKTIASKYASDNMYKSFIAKGVDGFPTRIKAGEHGHTMQMDLVKSENRALAASLFSLDGYTKAAGGAAAATRQDVRGMTQKIQEMTPQQREKWVDSLKRLYGK
jgi:hypothetical protein